LRNKNLNSLYIDNKLWPFLDVEKQQLITNGIDTQCFSFKQKQWFSNGLKTLIIIYALN